MAKGEILKIFYKLLTLPYIFLYKIFYKYNIYKFKEDYDVVNSVALRCKIVPDKYIYYLIIAEDHRNGFHLGVDQYAVMRCIYLRIFYGKIQGGSTIEQQFVRTVTGHKDRSILRKIIEQMLAVKLCCDVPKKIIASAYIRMAYYGHYKISFVDLIKRNVIYNISCLKYPEPKKLNEQWIRKLSSRILHIYYISENVDFQISKVVQMDFQDFDKRPQRDHSYARILAQSRGIERGDTWISGSAAAVSDTTSAL